MRAQLADVQKARQALREQDRALMAIENSLLRWLDLETANTQATLPLSITTKEVKLPETQPKPGAKILLKDAVLLVLRNRAGTTMTTEEIYEAAKALGAESRSKTPLHVVEWIIQEAQKFANAPVIKEKPHHYRWAHQEGASA